MKTKKFLESGWIFVFSIVASFFLILLLILLAVLAIRFLIGTFGEPMFVIMEKYEGSPCFTVGMKFEREDDMIRTLEGLRKLAKRKNIPVEYQAKEVDEVLDYDNREQVEADRGKIVVFDQGKRFTVDADSSKSVSQNLNQGRIIH